ncbi:MAG: long-chain fatty acid transporter, partial [Cyclobacteriaceae bacterium]
MRRIEGFWLVGFLMLTATWAHGQSFAETALLFSRTNPGGSARIQSLGGAQIALGGDYSTALSNPAGLGMFNRSEFTITPALNLTKSSSSYLGQSTDASKTTFHVPGFSLSFHKDYDKLVGFLGGTFTIGYTRTNDFNRNIMYEGTNPNNSLIDFFLEDANGFPVSQFASGGDLENTPTHLGYENYLIGDSTVFDINANPNAYFTDVLGIPFQTEEIETRGAQNQWSFAYGTNYNDKLFLGAGIGVSNIKYKSKKTYREAFENEPVNDLVLEEALEIR